MSTLVVTHADDGSITDWRYEVDDDYEPSGNELVCDEEVVDHRDIDKGKCKVDTSVDPPEVVEKPDYDPRSMPERNRDNLGSLTSNVPVQRKKISQETKDEFLRARESGDVQAQLDILYEVITGDDPNGS